MIGDNSDAKTIFKKMHHSPNTYFLFDPKAHFTNAQTFYLAMKRQVNDKYYGKKSAKKKEGANPLKGSSFENCQLPSELFNVNRMVKMNTKQLLSRMGFLTLRDGTIEVKGQNKPELPELKNLMQSLEQEYDLGQSFAKPDFYTSFPFLEGIISADSMKTNGIRIRCLSERIVYPLYGVWSPTSQDYLDLFSNYVT